MVTQLLVARGMPKASQADARYTPAGGRERCGACRHFMAPSVCNRILGPVTAVGWCRYYSQKPPHRAANFPGMGPPGMSLGLNFMSPGALDPSITFTRASTATYFDSTGTMQTAATNAPRWDYNPTTHGLNGLLVESAQTNLLLNSATLGTQGVAVTAQPYTLSFYGTGTITRSGAATGTLIGAGAFPQRVSQTFTPSAGTLTCTVTGSVLNAQLEAGGFATSYVPTSGAAVTRAADLASMPVGAWFNTTHGTYQIELTPNGSPNTGPAFLSGNAGSPTIGTDGFNQLNSAIRTVVQVFQNVGPTFAYGSINKAAFGYVSGASMAAVNGTAFGPNATTFSVTGTVVQFGSDGVTPGTNAIDGWIRRVSYWPRVLSNAELQAVTT